MQATIWVGGYGAKGEDGVRSFRFCTQTGELVETRRYDGLQRPSFLALGASGGLLYAVEELTPMGFVHALRITPNGLEEVATLASRGADPCHLSLASEGRLLLVSNYSSGSLGVFPLDDKGVPREPCELIAHEGRGANPVRQEASHAHFAREADGVIYATDLGLDCVYRYRTGAEGLAECGAAFALPSGVGPRHLAFDDQRIYVACELSNEVVVLGRQDGAVLQRIGTLPADFAGESTVAAIRLCDGFLFVSNRGSDSIAAYEIGRDGTLSLCDVKPCGGCSPRDFDMVGEWLVVANQASDSLSALRWQRDAKRLSSAVTLASMVKPTCVCVQAP